MANSSILSGLAPVRYHNGSPWNGAVNTYAILAANTNPFWIGDAVTTVGSAGGDSIGLPTVTLAAAGAPIRGVIIAIGLFPTGPYGNPSALQNLSRPTGAQTQVYYAAVVDDPAVLFEIQEGGAGSVLTTSSVSRNVNLNTGVRNAAIVPTFSPAFLDNATVSTGAALSLKIIQAVLRGDNQPFTASQKWLVRINNHEFNAGTASS